MTQLILDRLNRIAASGTTTQRENDLIEVVRMLVNQTTDMDARILHLERHIRPEISERRGTNSPIV